MRRAGVLVCVALAACAGEIEGPLTLSPPDRQPAPAPAVAPMEPPAPPAACRPAPARLWKLTPRQYARTVSTFVAKPGAPDEELTLTLAARHDTFSNDATGLELSAPHVGQLWRTARALSLTAVAEATAATPCLRVAAPADSCVSSVVSALAVRAFRRDPTMVELEGLVGLYQRQRASVDPVTALRGVVTALLMSPHFLFRSELGPEAPAAVAPTLTAFERASAISYFLTDGPPDFELLAAARDGALLKADQMAAQARRLLAGADAAVGIVRFLHEHFGLAAVREKEKDRSKFPWSEALYNAVADEADLFVRDVFFGSERRFQRFFTGLQGFANRYNGKAIYGRSDNDTKVMQPVALPWQWAGLLTRPGLTAALAREDDTDPVARGKFIRVALLCQELPSPPEDLDVVPPPPDGKRTQRQRLAQHSSGPCATCHALMDPLGLAFENYDAIGRHRTLEAGQNIDASGRLTGARPEGAAFADGVELSALLAASPDARSCFAQRLWTYANGRAPGNEDRCALEALIDRFDRTQGDLIDLAVATAVDAASAHRQPR